MQIRRTATGVEVLAPAKINLFFEVLAKRDDGFHEIETLMAPIGLYDTLFVEDDPSGGVSLEARWSARFRNMSNGISSDAANEANPSIEALPEDEKNHAVRAIRLLALRAGLNHGARLRLVKRIPAAAGLGGGSSDAAAALLAANLVWNLNWSIDRLTGFAAEIGSDVPFFLLSRWSICRGRGERIQQINGTEKLHLVIVRPPVGLSTAEVYGACRPGNPLQRVENVVETLQAGRLLALGPITHNRLLASARELSPWIDRTLALLTKEHCSAIGMSGSGSTCFGICRHKIEAERIAARIACLGSEIGMVWHVSTA